MTDPWACRYSCGYVAVVPSLARDHEQTCQLRPSAPEERR